MGCFCTHLTTKKLKVRENLFKNSKKWHFQDVFLFCFSNVRNTVILKDNWYLYLLIS